MAQLSRHGKLAREYWETYRPQALEQLGSQEEQATFFQILDLRVGERISEVTHELLQQVPIEQRGAQRAMVRMQAQELVYAEEIFVEKEPGTESREM